MPEFEPSHINIRTGGNIQYMRVTPAEKAMGYLVATLGYIAAVLVVVFILSLIWNGITITEVQR